MHVNDASLQERFVCHASRFRVRFVISCDFCARSHVDSLPTSFGGFRYFRCLESQKQHKPWQFERTHVSGASLQKRFVRHPSCFRVRFVISCDVCARSHVGSLPTSFGGFRTFRCLESQKHLTTNEVPQKGYPEGSHGRAALLRRQFRGFYNFVFLFGF